VLDPDTGTYELRNSAPGQLGDSKPDFIYDPSTGDLAFRTDGRKFMTWMGEPSFVALLSVESTSGILRPDNTDVGFLVGVGTWTNNLVAAAKYVAPGFTDGFDLGPVLPPG